MWQLISAELAYQSRRAWLLYAGAALVATLSNSLFSLAPPKGYFMYAALFFFAGLLLHVMTLWDADSETRFSLASLSRASRWVATRMAPPL